MTNTPSRRAIVAGTSAGLAVAGGELAAFVRPAKANRTAEAPGPIELGYSDFEVLARAHNDTCSATWTAKEHYVEPERPGWHPAVHEGGHKVVPTGNGKGRVYLDDSSENIAHLRRIIEAPETVFTAEGWEPEMFPPRVAAAQRTLDEILTWQTEARRRADAVGLTEALAIERAANTAASESARALLAIEPGTFREAAFQAAIIHADCYSDSDVDIHQLVKNLVRLAGIRMYWRDA